MLILILFWKLVLRDVKLELRWKVCIEERGAEHVKGLEQFLFRCGPPEILAYLVQLILMLLILMVFTLMDMLMHEPVHSVSNLHRDVAIRIFSKDESAHLHIVLLSALHSDHCGQQFFHWFCVRAIDCRAQ